MISLLALHLNLLLTDPLYYLSTLRSQWRQFDLRATTLRYCVYDEYVKTYGCAYNSMPYHLLIGYHNVYK